MTASTHFILLPAVGRKMCAASRCAVKYTLLFTSPEQGSSAVTLREVRLMYAPSNARDIITPCTMNGMSATTMSATETRETKK